MNKFIILKKITLITSIFILLVLKNVYAKIGDNYECQIKVALKNEVLTHYSTNLMFRWDDESIIFLDHINETNPFSDIRFNKRYKIIFQNNISFVARNENTREGELILHTMNFIELDKITFIMNASTYNHIYSGHYDCKKIN